MKLTKGFQHLGISTDYRLQAIQGAREAQDRLKTVSPLELEVIYTTDAGTQHALDMACKLAEDLTARIRLVYVYTVPYALPLNAPAVPLAFLVGKLGRLAANFPNPVSVHIFLCRDRLETLQRVLKSRSIVVVGGARRGWLSSEQRLARKLRKSRHEVIFVPSR